MEHIRKTLDESTVNRLTVNSNNKYTNSVNSISYKNKDLVKKICDLIEEENLQPEGIAIRLAELLNDNHSLKYYILLVKEHNPGALFDAAYIAKEKFELGELRTSIPIYFIGILRKKGLKTKFQ